MNKLPTAIRDSIQNRLWAECDDMGWMGLPYSERAPYYERWTKDPEIGGQLAHVMDPRVVRVYIKDTLIKPYVRERLLSSEDAVRAVLELAPTDAFVHRYVKPHGFRLADGRILCWGRSREWKSILLAVFERAAEARGAHSFAAVFVESGQTETIAKRTLVRDAARLLGIERIEWLDSE